jgi:hypothetical protein
MAEAIICRPLSTQTLVRSQASTCKFRCGQCDTPTGFLPSTWFFPVTIILPMLHVRFHFILLLPEGQTGEAWELPKNSSFGNRGELDRQTDRQTSAGPFPKLSTEIRPCL